MKITVETTVRAPVEDAWRAWTDPDAICHWNAATDAWHCPSAELDLRPGGRFSYRMEARDGSTRFDYAGHFTRVIPHERLESVLDDERTVQVEFLRNGDDASVIVRETFDTISDESADRERIGWQAILDRFARRVGGG